MKGSSSVLFSRSARIGNASSSYSWAMSHLAAMSENLRGLGSLSLPRGLWQPRRGCKQDDDENELQSKRHSPINSGTSERHAVVHPVGKRKAGNVQDELDHYQLSSPLDLTCLGLPNRCLS